MRYFRKITGARLYLSPVSDHDCDLEKYIKWMNDKAVAANFSQYNRTVSSKSDMKWLFTVCELSRAYETPHEHNTQTQGGQYAADSIKRYLQDL